MSKSAGWKDKMVHLTYDKPGINKKLLDIKKSYDELNKLLNGNNKKDTKK